MALTSLGSYALNPGVAVNEAWLEPMYDYLIGTKTDGTLEAESGFITSWIANAEFTVWTFKMRSDAVFHNGDRPTSADVAFTLQLSADKRFSRGAELQRSIGKLELPDSSTMIATLTGADFLWQFTYLSRNPPGASAPKVLVPKEYTSRIGQEAANKQPIGSGPYKFKSATVGEKIVMEAVEKHFYFGIPKTKTVNFIAAPEEIVRFALVQTKAVDAAPVSVENAKKARLAGIAVVTRDNAQIVAMWNSQYPEVMQEYGPNPLANETVRKALSWYAIDRKALVAAFLGGQGTPSMDYPVNSWDLGERTRLPVPAYDLAKARSTLAEAGYPNGFGIDYYIPQAPRATFPTEQVAEAIAVYWEAAGIKVNRQQTADLNALLRAVFDKQGFSKPTVFGLTVIGNRAISSSTAVLQHDPKATFSVNRDPKGLQLATEFLRVTSLDAYKTKGESYRQYAYEHAATFIPIFEPHDLWVRSDKISSKWRLGRDTHQRLDAAAALR